MLCDICKKNEANIHLTQIIEGKMLKVDLCESCAKSKGVQDPIAGFSLSDLLAGLGVVEETKAETTALSCPQCGMTQADFKKSGRLGCAECWDAFAAGLAPLLKAMHKGDQHTGKVPRKAAHTLLVRNQIRDLTEQLEAAVKAEKYEDAAQLRDKIRALEAKLKATKSVPTP